MPRKPLRTTRQTAEERRIEQQRAELLRKQQELEARLVALPAVIEQQRKASEQKARDRARSASPPISPGRGRPVRRPGPRGTPGRRARVARIKAVSLLALFVLILFLVWRAIPAG